jgi:hypothetical protein
MIASGKPHAAEIGGGDSKGKNTHRQDLQIELASHFYQRKIAGRKASQIDNQRHWRLFQKFSRRFVRTGDTQTVILVGRMVIMRAVRKRSITR